MAAGKENCLKAPPQLPKPMEAEAAVNQRPCRKRDALGELKHLSVSTAIEEPKEEMMIDDSGSESNDPQFSDSDSDSEDSESDASDVSAEEEEDSCEESDDDSQSCEGFASSIYDYLREIEMEEHRRPLPDYIEKVQNDVTAMMRAVLVDWLVEVAEEYNLLSTTLYLAVSYIDRFLSRKPLNRKKLQLLGVASMLIASKYEEISPPRLDDFCFITDNTYTTQELAEMEAEVLALLNHEMGNPTTKSFLTRITKIAAQEYADDEEEEDGNEDEDEEGGNDSKLEMEFLGDFLGELSLLDYECVKFAPSLVASAAVFVANLTLCPDTKPWSDDLWRYSGYKAEDLKECVLILHELQLGGRSGKAVREKYRQHKFKSVSTLSPPVQIPSSYFLH